MGAFDDLIPNGQVEIKGSRAVEIPESKRNKRYSEFLKEALISAFPPAPAVKNVDQMFQPVPFNQAGEGLDVIARLAMGVPEDVSGASASQIISEVLKAPVSFVKEPKYGSTFLKGVMSDVAGLATTPASYIPIPAAKLAGKIPMGKSTLAEVANVPISHISKVVAGDAVPTKIPFGKYVKPKFTQEDILASEVAPKVVEIKVPEDVKPKWYHGGKAGFDGDLIDGMVTRNYDEALKYAKETGGVVYEVPDEAVIRATAKDTTADGYSLGKNFQNYGFVKPIKAGQKGWSAKTVPPPAPPSAGELGSDLLDNAKNWKDISKIERGFLSLTRQIEKVAGQDAPRIKEALVDKIKNNVTNMINERKARLVDLKATIVDHLGIKTGSKESKAVFQFGEGRLSLDELKKQFPKKWQNIVEADRYFRAQYNELLDAVNASLTRNGLKPILKRQDYYTHIREQGNVFQRLLNPKEISPGIMEGGEFVQPNKPFNPFAIERKGEKAVEDAVGAYVKYLNPTLAQTHLTDTIKVLKTFRSNLIKTLPNPEKLSIFLDSLKEYVSILALKPNVVDKLLDEKIVPGVVKNLLNFATHQFSKNAILYNASSALSNFLPFAQLATEIGPAKALKALYASALDGAGEEKALGMSKFLQRRFNDVHWNELAPKDWYEQGTKAGAWLFKSIDTLTARATWMGLYDDALSKGLNGEKAIQFADDMADKLLQDRSLGSIPLAFTSRYARVFLQFQTEINNFNSYAIELGVKDPKKLATLFTYTFLANRVFEQVNGRAPLPDPYMAAWEALQSKNDKGNFDPIKAVGRLSGEVLSNVIGGQIIANMYPEYGLGTIGGKKKKNFLTGKTVTKGGIKTPTRKEFFGRSEAGRFASTPLEGALKKPQYMLAPPFGGAQFKKTFEGIKVLDKEYVQYGNKKIKIKDIPDKIKAVIFGPSATKPVIDEFNKPKKKKSQFKRLSKL